MKRGFTLTEVLVVSAIIAALAGILFPVFNIVKNRAKHAACANNIHQLGEAEHLYANDHDGWVPPATTAATTAIVSFDAPPGEIDKSPGVLRMALDPYVKSEEAWFCPTDPHAHEDVLWLGQRHLRLSYWIYPVADILLKHQWPPRLQLMGNLSPEAAGVPLICDAVGIPNLDSAPQFKTGDNNQAESNHPDRMVNVLRADLSLERRTAKYMMGTDQ